MSEQNSSKSASPEKFYLLPNLLTTAGLFSGFYAIISATNGKFEAAAVAIFIAMIFDGLDGRVARLTNTQSEFGAEYDSMADIVSFGIAPALLAYNFALQDLGKFGWLSAFIYVACAALRLARFNTQTSQGPKNYFQGLASPAAAAILASAIWVATEFELAGSTLHYGIAGLTILMGLLMVSNFRYSAFKEIDWRNTNTFLGLLVIVLVFVLVAARPAEVLFIAFLIYGLSGPAIGIKSMKLEDLVDHNKDADFDDVSIPSKKDVSTDSDESQNHNSNQNSADNENSGRTAGSTAKNDESK